VTLKQLSEILHRSIAEMTPEQTTEIREHLEMAFLPISSEQWRCDCGSRHLLVHNWRGLRALLCPECDLGEIFDWLGNEPILTASDRWLLREVGAGDYNELNLNLFDDAFLRSIQVVR